MGKVTEHIVSSFLTCLEIFLEKIKSDHLRPQASI